ncbi:MAG TPA: protein translocase SEC61 complex subunit gamma [Euryarchaeota archaeon]|nr:protein translocase SEC61 complex subunit gamma [Euryarchaeota archaeon]
MEWLDKSWKTQKKVEEKFKSIGSGKYARVLKMARKPEKEEYIRTIQISSIGLGLVGLLGFCIYLLWLQIPKLFEIF